MELFLNSSTTALSPGGTYSLVSNEGFLYDGWNLTAIIRQGAAATTHTLSQTFIWGPDLSSTMQGAGGVGGLLMIVNASTSKIHFPAYDGNGNIMALLRADTGTAATIDAAYEYDPFGRTLRSTGPYASVNPFRFSTKFTDDETGLVYYGYRYLDVGLGRWLCRDPAGEDEGQNLLSYGGNDEINTCDVLGRAIDSFKELPNASISGTLYAGVTQHKWGTGLRFEEAPRTDWPRQVTVKGAATAQIFIQDATDHDEQGRGTLAHERLHVEIARRRWEQLKKFVDFADGKYCRSECLSFVKAECYAAFDYYLYCREYENIALDLKAYPKRLKKARQYAAKKIELENADKERKAAYNKQKELAQRWNRSKCELNR